MIRMGKSSKLSEPEVNEQNEPAHTPAVSFSSDSQSPNAFSESELMARDIKEGRLSGFVGSGTVLTGETVFESMLRIDGHVKGQVSSKDGTLIIGATGQVDADIIVGTAVINGAVNGDIFTSEKLTLGRSARVVGNIQAARLVMEDGAVLEGNCSMLKPQQDLEARIAESQKQYSTGELTSIELADEDESVSVNDFDAAVDDADDAEDLEETAEAAAN
ncbi:MAG: polymer-forming cytoskeletal protein [Pyrinomonadaceae bacterium]